MPEEVLHPRSGGALSSGSALGQRVFAIAPVALEVSPAQAQQARRERLRATLLSCATPPGAFSSPSDPALVMLAGVLSQAWAVHGLQWLPLPGLDAPSTRALLDHWFPQADLRLGLDWAALQGANRVEPRADEIVDLVALLREHASAAPAEQSQVHGLAHAIALASLGGQHLWQDLGFASRRELSALMQTWFAGLVALNVGDMKWKKFFYRQLCLKEEVLVCKSPSCDVCSDHPVCFGHEDSSGFAH